MNFEEQESTTTTTTTTMTRLINDENNNFPCTNCEYPNPKNERMRIGSNISSDDEEEEEEEFCCSSCSSDNETELIAIDTRKLWHDLAHLIKCIYRETNREFAENHSTNDICKAKEYVQILTQSNAESFFKKLESIALEYVDEIRNQVLKRSQTYLKASNDVQLFITYLLDEYNTFIQAAKNVSTIVSYLEDHYMKSFHLTWLLYNKYLYEKFVYMDKKIQQAMSIMIDLLQPTNDNDHEYSPAEYTQLLNRFLAFDEEMSEIACLYKDCQMKMTSMGRNSLRKNRNSVGIVVKTSKKKLCKKAKRIPNKSGKNKDNFNSSTSNAVNIPSSINSTIIPIVSLQDSNGSSIGSGLGGKESSSISSFDEYSLGNNTTSSSYTKEEIETTTKELYPEISDPIPTPTPELNKNEDPKAVNSTKKSKSTRRKDNTHVSKASLPPDRILPPKPPSKLQADFRPLTMPLLTKNEMPACPSVLSAKIQSVSFTAGTFGSITNHQSPTNRPHLSLNLSKKADSTIALNNLDQLLRQAASPNEISAFLSTLGSSEDFQKDKKCDFCCCDVLAESNPSSLSSTPNHCLACMSLPNPTTITCAFNQREVERKERLKLKFNKRIVQTPPDPPKISTGNKSKIKPCDNNIDDLVRFIDGDEGTSTERTSKKKKKKKSTPKNPPVIDTPEPSSIEKQDIQVHIEEPIDPPSIIKPPTPPIVTSLQEKIESTPENPLSPEEEVNWITISRKQSKHKPTSIPSLLAVPIVPPNNPKPKQSPTAVKRKPSKTQTLAQEKVIPETVTNSKKSHTIAPSARVQTTGKTSTVQQPKTETPSAWTTHEQTPIPPVVSTSTLLATAPAFVPSASLLIPNQTNDLLPLDQPTSSLYWDPEGYLLPPGPVQRPSAPFSPAPGPRCIRRPSPEPSTTTFPNYSPLNYTSTWNETSERKSNESQWKYPYEEQLQTTTIPDDFPLYDPFNSGAGLTISPSSLLNNGLEENDIDEMNALDKEIEDFKKCYIDTLPFDSRDKLQGNIDHRFTRQS